jgi:hypothetical protein
MRAALACLALAACSAGAPGPVIGVDRPTVLAVWAQAPDSIVHRDEDLASAYDQLMYYWSESRPRLDSMGVSHDQRPLAWQRPRIVVDCHVLELSREMAIGYVLAAPGREPRLIAGLLMDEELADSVRSYLGSGISAGAGGC